MLANLIECQLMSERGEASQAEYSAQTSTFEGFRAYALTSSVPTEFPGAVGLVITGPRGVYNGDKSRRSIEVAALELFDHRISLQPELLYAVLYGRAVAHTKNLIQAGLGPKVFGETVGRVVGVEEGESFTQQLKDNPIFDTSFTGHIAEDAYNELKELERSGALSTQRQSEIRRIIEVALENEALLERIKSFEEVNFSRASTGPSRSRRGLRGFLRREGN